MDGGRVTRPPLWGGIECTVARIGDAYVDQIRLTGHEERLDDLDRIARLGVRALRYPVLWERVAPNGLRRADWRWTDERLERLRALGIEPIVTLVHHGSGPRDTNLLDPAFPRKLARFARAVAKRYPWLRFFTPVNEPLTTARFSALYGVWYPHARDDRAFLLALKHQVLAIAAAMREIRTVIPGAQLVQTEDLGHVRSTRELAYQAAWENERRFVTLDLLCGRVNRRSPFFQWAAPRGLAVEAESLQDMHCPPDVIGLNYYVTSERFLDHRLAFYPGIAAGGNERERYVDVEAVRVDPEGVWGFARLASEVWLRYGRPIAMTEAHLGCTPDEQLRWVDEQYREACALSAAGADVRGFTVWSLLGAYEWDSLLACRRGTYEPGAFDVSDGNAKETAIARWMRAVAAGERFDDPALSRPGWWRRADRLLYNPENERTCGARLPSAS